MSGRARPVAGRGSAAGRPAGASARSARVRIAAHDVQVDLQRATGPARLGLADASRRWPGGSSTSAAWSSSPRSTSGLLASMARNCGAKPWSEATNVVGSLPISDAGERQDLVGLLVGAPDVGLARGDAAVRDAVQVDVVIGGVGRAVRELRADEAEELVLELVGRRASREQRSGWYLFARTRASARGRSPSRGPARRRCPR